MAAWTSHSRAAPEGQKVVLVVPPFQTVARPSLGVSQLKASLEQAGFGADVVYLNLPFAERIGLGVYEWIGESLMDVLFGEFVFSHALFDRSEEDIDRYVSELLKPRNLICLHVSYKKRERPAQKRRCVDS